MPNPLKKTSATEPGLIFPYSLSKARRIASPFRFSPISTLKPSRLSSSATARASLIGSLSGASASGYLALPMTSANRSAAAAAGTIGKTDKIEISNKARRVLIKYQSSQQGADTSLRLGDLTPRKPHYQTGPASPVNRLRCQSYQRQLTAMRPGNKSIRTAQPAAMAMRGFRPQVQCTGQGIDAV